MKTCILLSHTKCCSESLLPTISIDSIVSLISASIFFKSFSLLSTFDAKFGSYPGGTCFNQKKNINKISIKYTVSMVHTTNTKHEGTHEHFPCATTTTTIIILLPRAACLLSARRHSDYHHLLRQHTAHKQHRRCPKNAA